MQKLCSLHESLETSEDICYLKESQIDNALAHVVVDTKTNIINNHAVTLTSLITLVVERTATYKRLVSQLAEVLGRQKNYFPWPKTNAWCVELG